MLRNLRELRDEDGDMLRNLLASQLLTASPILSCEGLTSQHSPRGNKLHFLPLQDQCGPTAFFPEVSVRSDFILPLLQLLGL